MLFIIVLISFVTTQNIVEYLYEMQQAGLWTVEAYGGHLFNKTQLVSILLVSSKCLENLAVQFYSKTPCFSQHFYCGLLDGRHVHVRSCE